MDSNENLDIWEQRVKVLQSVNMWCLLVDNGMQCLLPIVVLILVTAVYKRNHWFLIAIPTFIFMFGSLRLATNI